MNTFYDIEMMADNLMFAINFLVDAIYDFVTNIDNITDIMIPWYKKNEI